MPIHHFTDTNGVRRAFYHDENANTIEILLAEAEHEERDLGREDEAPADPQVGVDPDPQVGVDPQANEETT